MADHHCHARGCGVATSPSMFMCKNHWYMVPANLRGRIWLHYRLGQEISKDPSPEYLEVTRDAINCVAEQEVSNG